MTLISNIASFYHVRVEFKYGLMSYQTFELCNIRNCWALSL